KLVIISSLALGLYFPKPRLFVLPFLPIATWLILFYSCRFIPGDRRPHIYVSVLPALENILYGDNLSAIIARHTNTLKDLLAWFPYGVAHFTLPFFTSIGLWWVGPPGILAVFARAFGYMNIAGVLTQLSFPCSPPWYEYIYGMNTPAKYTMPGHPGGLARIDTLFSSTTYTTTFSGSPMVFGAFPSLHSGCAIIQALFISYVLPKSRIICILYVMWIWWACMYLTHHYMVDLVGGGIYAVIAFWFSWKWLPSVRYEFSNRWDYVKAALLPRTTNDIVERTPMYAIVAYPSSRDASIDMDNQAIEDKNAALSTSSSYDSNDEFDLGHGVNHHQQSHYQNPHVIASSDSINLSEDIEAL
ncbi:7265_t:CDS:2, partial [Ambispora gerdemannii]